MKAKFIKHSNPRETLGISLDKRKFIDGEDFARWATHIFIPIYYNAPNLKLALEEFMRNKSLPINKGNAFPSDLFSRLYNIISESSFENLEVFGNMYGEILGITYRYIKEYLKKFGFE